MYVYVIIYIYSTLWLFNIAIGNDPFQYLNQNKSSINGPFSMAMLDQYSFVEAGIFDPVLHGADTAGAGELPHRFFLTALQILGAVFVFFWISGSYDNITTTSLDMMSSKGNHTQMPNFFSWWRWIMLNPVSRFIALPKKDSIVESMSIAILLNSTALHPFRGVIIWIHCWFF